MILPWSWWHPFSNSSRIFPVNLHFYGFPMTFPIETSIYSWISHDFPTIFPWFSHGPATPGPWSSAESWLKDSAAAGWKHSPWKAQKIRGGPGENLGKTLGKSAKCRENPAENLGRVNWEYLPRSKWWIFRQGKGGLTDRNSDLSN